MNDQEFDLQGALGLLRRQIWTIFFTFVIVVGAAAAIIFNLNPAYTSTTLIMVEPTDSDLLTSSQSSNPGNDGARVDGELEIVLSEPIVMDVLVSENLLQDPEFAYSPGLVRRLTDLAGVTQPEPPTDEERSTAALNTLYDALEVQRRGLTNLFTISATVDDPDTAARIANALARSYVKAQVESKIASKLQSRDIIKGRIQSANEEVIESEDAIDQYIDENIDRIAEQTGRTDLVTLRNDLRDTNAERSRLASMIDLADRYLGMADWTSLDEVVDNNEFTNLQQQFYELQARAQTLPSDSDAYNDLQTQISQTQDQLRELATDEIGSLRQDVANAQALASDLRIQLRSSSLATELPTETLTKLYELQQNAEFARNQYTTLLSRLNQLESEAYLQVADSRVVSQATSPESPSFPNTRLLLILASIGAMGVAVTMAFAVENYVGGITSEGQLESLLRVSVAATVPRVSLPRAKKGEPEILSHADLMITAPFSPYAEAVRRAQIGVDQALRRLRGRQSNSNQGSVIMFASANASEGKTTMCLSLARAYAAAGRSTLVLDCDLRKPSLHKQVGLEPSSGLAEHLSAKPGEQKSRDLSPFLAEDPRSNATLILGAHPDTLPTTRPLSSGTLVRLIEAARSNYEVIIIDTAPIGAIADGLYLAQCADVIVDVNRWAKTTASDAKNTVAALRETKPVQTEILAILNMKDVSKRKLRKKYSTYYDI